MNFINNGTDLEILNSLIAKGDVDLDMLKSMGFDIATEEELVKARNFDKTKMHQVQVTVRGKNGTHTRMQWVKNSEADKGDKSKTQEEEKKPKKVAKPEEEKDNSKKADESKDTKSSKPEEKSDKKAKAEEQKPKKEKKSYGSKNGLSLEAKAKIANFIHNHETKDKKQILQQLKDAGVEWKECEHEGVNWMRAHMAANKLITQGKLNIDDIGKPPVEEKKSEEQPEFNPDAVQPNIDFKSPTKVQVRKMNEAASRYLSGDPARDMAFVLIDRDSESAKIVNHDITYVDGKPQGSVDRILLEEESREYFKDYLPEAILEADKAIKDAKEAYANKPTKKNQQKIQDAVNAKATIEMIEERFKDYCYNNPIKKEEPKSNLPKNISDDSGLLSKSEIEMASDETYDFVDFNVEKYDYPPNSVLITLNLQGDFKPLVNFTNYAILKKHDDRYTVGWVNTSSGEWFPSEDDRGGSSNTLKDALKKFHSNLNKDAFESLSEKRDINKVYSDIANRPNNLEISPDGGEGEDFINNFVETYRGIMDITKKFKMSEKYVTLLNKQIISRLVKDCNINEYELANLGFTPSNGDYARVKRYIEHPSDYYQPEFDVAPDLLD